MKIIPYDPSMLGDLTCYFNGAIECVPHCFPVEPREMEEELALPADSRRQMEAEQIVVIQAKAGIEGYAHYVISRGDERYPEPRAIIRFLHYDRGRRQVGQALIEAVEEDTRRRGIDTITAFPNPYRYRFYCYNHAFLSNYLHHVEALLGFNGYEKVGGEVFLDSANYAPASPAPINFGFEVALEWIEGDGERQDLTIRAMDGDNCLGVCEHYSCQTYAPTADLRDWAFCNWLGVEEEVQGKRLGKYLLQKARLELHRVGYRHVSISTAAHNHRAHMFYANDGYDLVHWTYCWKKTLLT